MQRRYTVKVEPRGDRWQARVYLEGEGGKSRRFSTGVLIGTDRRVSEREATRVAEDRAADLAREASLSVANDDTSLDAVAERMLAQKTADAKRARAVDALAFNLDKHVKPFFHADRDVRTIKRRDLEAFKAHLRGANYKPTTINNALTGIRQVLKHACEIDETIEYVPVVKNVPVDTRGTGKPLTPAQVARFIAAFKPEEIEAREFNLFLLNTGLRKAEALAVRWDWIDWQAKELRIPGQVRKGGKEQRTPTALNRTALELLRARQGRDDQPSKGRVWWQLKTYDKARRAAATRAGVTGYRHHDARHTRATQLGAAGATGIDLRDAMNWSTMAMVSKYTHPDRQRVHDLAARVDLGVTGDVTGEEGPRRAVRGVSGKGKKSGPDGKPRKLKAL